jgi:hypothetical protein
MNDLAITLLRKAASLSAPSMHPWLSRLSARSVGFVTSAASIMAEDPVYCDGNVCHGFELCPAGGCLGSACGYGCHSSSEFCESGTSCWQRSGIDPTLCCDCLCCTPLCYYCVCY